MALAVLVLPFVLLVIGEIVAIVAMFQWIGWWTLLALFGTSLIGIFLFVNQGRRHVAELKRQASEGRVDPGTPGDAILIATGSLLLILPGFVTDVIGLILALPFTRPAVRGAFGWWLRRISGPRRPMGDATTIKGEVIRDEETDADKSQDSTKDKSSETNDGPLYLEGTVIDVAEDERQ